MRLLLWVPSVLLAILALSGCDGDNGPAGPTLPSGRATAPSAPDDAGPASKLGAKFLAGVDGKYGYRYTGTIGTISEGALVVYRLGVNDRHDWTVNQFGFDATTVSILGTEDNYLCTIAGSVNTCRVATVPELEALRVFYSPIFDALAALVTEPDKFEIEGTGSETYAGMTGNCHHAVSEARIGEGPPSSEEIKACYTDSGVLLYFERTVTPDSASIPAGTYTLTLTEAADALPSDFEPTAPVR
jgi:hypothetical protein